MKHLLVLLTLLAFLSSCSEKLKNAEKPNLPEEDMIKEIEKDQCVKYQLASIIEAQLPETAKVSETVAIDVTFEVTNTCGKFHSFKEEMIGDTLNVSVQAKYVGCMCGAMMKKGTNTYSFSSTRNGTTYIKFLQRHVESPVQTIEIE